MSSPSIAAGAISAAAANGPTIAVSQLTVKPGNLTVSYQDSVSILVLFNQRSCQHQHLTLHAV